MTVLEALKGTVIMDVPTGTIDKVLADIGLNGSDTYVPTSHKEVVDTAAASILKIMPYSSISEGGYSISFSEEARKQYIQTLEGNLPTRGIEKLSI